MVRLLTDRLTSIVLRHRGPVLVLLGLLFLGMGYQATRLRGDFTPQDLFVVSDEQQAITEAFKARFGDTENVVLVVVEFEDLLQGPVVQYIHDLSRHFQTRPYVDRVESLTVTSFARRGAPGEVVVGPVGEGERIEQSDLSKLSQIIEESALVERRLLSTSRRLTAVAVFLKRGLTRIEELTPVVQEFASYLDDSHPPEGVRALLSGLPYDRVVFVETFTADQAKLPPLSLLVALCALFLCFRWLPGTLLSGLVVIVTVAVTAGGMALVGERINILTQTLPTIIIIIGLSDSVHFLNRFADEARSCSAMEATRRAFRTMVVACFLTSVTTAVGLGSLGVARTGVVRRFGLTGAIGVLIAYGVTMTLVPAAIARMKPNQRSAMSEEGRLERSMVGLTRAVIARPWLVLAICLLALGGAVAGLTHLTVDARLMEYFDEDHEVVQTTSLIEREFSGILPFEVSLSSSREGRFDEPDVLNALQGLRDWALTQPGVLTATSYSDLLHEAWVAYTGDPSKRTELFSSVRQVAALASLLESGNPNPIEPFVSLNRRRTRLNIQLADIGANATQAFGDRLSLELEERFEGLQDVQVAFSGDAHDMSEGMTAVISDMLSSVATAFSVIFVMMFLVFRSLRMGLLSIPPNLIPLLVTMGYMGLRGIELNTVSLVIFSLGLGLAVDDTIHILHRFREETRAGYDKDEALLRTARSSGRAIVVTSFILIAGFLVLGFSSFLPIRRFGELASVLVAGCLLADVLMFPALIKVGWRTQPPVGGANSRQ